MFGSLLGGSANGGKRDTKKSGINDKVKKDEAGNLVLGQGKIAQTVQAEIGEKLWVSMKKEEDYSRMWLVQGVASLSADRRRVFVADEVTKKIYEVPAEQTLNYDLCHDVDFTDLTRMNYLHEASLLNTLQKRYMNDDIYTYFGDTLISINPYYDIPGKYEKKVDVETPHVYSIAEKTYSILKKKRRSQSIVINGDSGAGKTEAAKQIMRHMVSLCVSNSHATTPEIENLVLESTPVLEAFGNSVTLRNDNSSRFGRFIQIMYNDDGSAITGMNTLHFLLEKSRLIRRSPGERNYHIFYQLCAAMKPMGFKDALTYEYLLPALDANNYTGIMPDDALNFERTRNALMRIGIKEETQKEVWKVLLAILSIGNIDFVTSTEDKHNTGRCEMADSTLSFLETAAANLGISDAKNLETAMIQRTIEAGRNNETTVIHLTVEQAKDSRDALAKYLYSAVFDWVIEELNRQSVKNQKQKKSRKKDRFIGILDIFGFEDLEHNSFEQVCVNYANELLQKQFDFYVIESERRVFKEEGVEFPDITLPSILNSEKVLDLLTNHLFNILEEQCLLRSGTDSGFLTNLEKKKVLNDKFSMDWKNKSGFIVKHFAGEVSYDCTGFVEKNRDALTTDLKELIQDNCTEFLGQQIGTTPEERNRKMASHETVLKKFQKDMNNLVSTIGKTDQTFIRCIKPNLDQASKEWDVKLILSQLEYLGIMQAIRVHQDTYPIRREFSFIAGKYNKLLEGDNVLDYIPGSNDKEVMRAILTQTLGKDSEYKSWQCGYTKAFLGNEVLYALDSIVNQKRLARLAAMTEIDRQQELEVERKKQQAELKAARERFEREKKEEEARRKRLEEERKHKDEEERRRRLAEEDEERRQKLKADEERIKREEDAARKKLEAEKEENIRKLREEQERVRVESEKRLNALREQEDRRNKELNEKEAKLLADQEKKKQEWETERARLRKEEEDRKKQLEEERAKFEQLSAEKQEEVEKEEAKRKKFIEEQEARLKQEEEDSRKKLEAELKRMDEEQANRKKKVEEEEEKLEKQRQEKRQEIEAEEQRIKTEKESLIALEKEKLQALEEEEKRRNAELAVKNANIMSQQKKLDEEQEKLSALEQENRQKVELKQKQLREEEERILEEQEEKHRLLQEQEERLKAQEERLRQLEEDRQMREEQERQERERQRVEKEEREQQERQLKVEKATRRKQVKQEKKAKAEEMKRKKAKLARRKKKLDGALKLQAMVRGAIIRSHYRELLSRRKLFRPVLRPNELVAFSSLVVNTTAKSGSKNKRRVLVLTSEGRLFLMHPISLKIEQEAYYIPKLCKSVAKGKEFDVYLMTDKEGTTRLDWKFRDLLNEATTWVAVFDTLVDAPTYIKQGFVKTLRRRVSRKNVVVPIKIGTLKVLADDNAAQTSSSRLSLFRSKDPKGLLFLMTQKHRQTMLTWYENDKSESQVGKLAVDRRMKVVIPDTSSVSGKLNVFIFCLRVRIKKKERLYTLQAKGKDDRDQWVKTLREAIRIDKLRKTPNKLQALEPAEKNVKRKGSFNAAQFMSAFKNNDVAIKQNIKSFAADKE